MRVRVRNVNALPQTHIAVNDLFPAGFDLAPDGLKPGLGVASAEYVDVREDRAMFFTSLRPGESKTFEYAVSPCWNAARGFARDHLVHAAPHYFPAKRAHVSRTSRTFGE